MIAFNHLKQALVDEPIMKPPKYDESFEMICEASYNSIGVTLGQYDGSTFNIVHFASKTLNEAQRKYPMAEKELFAIVYGCDKFRSYISVSKVKVHTYRQGLNEIITRKDVKPRLIRWILLLQEFELQMVERTPEGGEEEPKIIELKFDDKKHEAMKICIPLENSLRYLIYNNLGDLAEDTVLMPKETNNGKLGDENCPPDISQ